VCCESQSSCVCLCDGPCVVQGVCKRRCLANQSCKCWCHGKPEGADCPSITAHKPCHGVPAIHMLPYPSNDAAVLLSFDLWAVCAASGGVVVQVVIQWLAIQYAACLHGVGQRGAQSQGPLSCHLVLRSALLLAWCLARLGRSSVQGARSWCCRWAGHVRHPAVMQLCSVQYLQVLQGLVMRWARGMFALPPTQLCLISSAQRYMASGGLLR
jgi:hypothetical protein